MPPTYSYEPAASHERAVLHLNGVEVRSGDTFGLDVRPEDHPTCARALEKTPGRTVGRRVLPCIVPVDAAPTIMANEAPAPPSGGALANLLGLTTMATQQDVVEAVKARTTALTRIAVALGLSLSCHPENVADAVVERMAHLVVPPAVPGTLDPTIRDTSPGAMSGPLGPDVRAIGEAAAPAVDVDEGEPRRQYELTELPETNAGLEKLAADNGVDLKTNDKRNRETRIAALRAAGLVAEG